MSHDNLILGIFETSGKENEFCLPIHPDHFPRIKKSLRPRIFFEENYGSRFGTDNSRLQAYSAGVLSREDLFKRCDILLIPKPVESDFPFFREGHILWGWPHCVQGEAITQVGIDKKMTLIAWESMDTWNERAGQTLWVCHTFHKNNELAGYCSVHHAMQLLGITGHFGPTRRAAVISFGSTARGAIYALKGLGIHEITAFAHRPYEQMPHQLPGIDYRHYEHDEKDPSQTLAVSFDKKSPMATALSKYDIIVNCILQDTDHPYPFVHNRDLSLLKPGTLIIDVSCDTGMGFEFARPTTFEDPFVFLDNNITYYAVDHTPSYLWNAATYEISRALLPHIPVVMAGKASWKRDLTINGAIEIEEGRVLNPSILKFQNREEHYPHANRTAKKS